MSEEPTTPTTFGQRHGVTILSVTLIGLLILVILVDMGC
jgi:hypothetical protein